MGASVVQNGRIEVDIDILKRFDKPGPRYTSYPTAPLFSSEYTEKTFEIDLITNNHDNRSPVSLYFHIPFCDTLCYFCGCTTVITPNREIIRKYVAMLKREISKTARYINRHRQVTQLAWGGGTPSYLTPGEIRDLSSAIWDRFTAAPDAEISAEIDPRGFTQEHMQAFRDGGVNRVSLGVQDFTEGVQVAVNRIQPEELTRNAIDWARDAGIGSVNIDLIYGLPLQTIDSFRGTLDRVIALSPERIAVFNFAYIPWMKPHQKLIHQSELPSADQKLLLLKTTIETLTAAGYEYIGMDHFARPTDELAIAQKQKTLYRNFQGYSTRAGADLFGFGMSSISHFGTVYAQNAKLLPEYNERIAGGRFATHAGYRMNRDDEIRKHVILRLMCDLEVAKRDVERLFSIDFDEYFESSLPLLDEFVEPGMLEHTAEIIRIVGPGRLLLRNIAMCFDAYLPALQGSRPLFSRTI